MYVQNRGKMTWKSISINTVTNKQTLNHFMEKSIE